jgi:hypothetical protein
VVERSANGGSSFAVVGTTEAGDTDFVDTGLADATAHTYRVFARNDAGASPVGTAAAISTPLAAPAGLTARGKSVRLQRVTQGRTTAMRNLITDIAGITVGNADGTYTPNAPVSRQAMAAFIYRANGSPAFTPPSTPSFTDFPSNAPFYKEVEWMKAQAITSGYDNGNGTWSYHGAEDVSRQAMAAFLFRADHN